MSETKLPRREFLLSAAGGAAVLTAASYAQVPGAGDRIQLGLIGCGDRGRHDMGLFLTNPAVEVTALCDVFADHIDQAKTKAPAARGFSDHRKLLELKEVDAVLIGRHDAIPPTAGVKSTTMSSATPAPKRTSR